MFLEIHYFLFRDEWLELRRTLDPPGPLYRTITKQLKFYAETSHARGPLNFAGKGTSTSLEIGRKYSATNIGQIVVHLFILDTLKR